MKIDRTSVSLASDPVTVAQATQQFDRIKRFMNTGLIDAENFTRAGATSRFQSEFIKEVSDSPNYSKYFVGQFFDNNSSSEAVALHTAYNTLVEEITTDELITSVDYQLVVNKDGYDLKTSNSYDLGGSIAGAVMLTPFTGGLSWLGLANPKTREFLDDAQEFVASNLNSGVKAIKNFFFGKRKKEKPKSSVQFSTQETIIIPVPFGYRYLKHSAADGGIYAEMASAFGKVFIDMIFAGDEFIVFQPQIKLTQKLGTDESYVTQGKIQIVLEKKI